MCERENTFSLYLGHNHATMVLDYVVFHCLHEFFGARYSAQISQQKIALEVHEDKYQISNVEDMLYTFHQRVT